MEETEDASDGLAMDEWRDIGSTELLLVLMCGGGDNVRTGRVALESPSLGGFSGGGGGAQKRMGLMGVRPSLGVEPPLRTSPSNYSSNCTGCTRRCRTRDRRSKSLRWPRASTTRPRSDTWVCRWCSRPHGGRQWWRPCPRSRRRRNGRTWRLWRLTATARAARGVGEAKG